MTRRRASAGSARTDGQPLARRPRRARAAARASTRPRSSSALGAVIERRGASRGRSTSRCAWRSPARTSRRASSRASRCSAARRRCGGSTPRCSERSRRSTVGTADVLAARTPEAEHSESQFSAGQVAAAAMPIGPRKRTRRLGWPANPRKGRTSRMQATAPRPRSAQGPTSRAAPRPRTARPSRARTARARAGERHQNEGHGRRLTMAFEALEAFPALAESRNRLLSVIAKDHVATADVVAAVESDVALIIAVLRLANRAQRGHGKVDTAVGAVELLSPQTVQAARQPRADVRLLRARERVGRGARALPPARARHPARRRPDRCRGRLREPRPPDRHEPAARRRQARPAARLPRLPLAGPPRRADARGAASTRSAASWASTTRSSAASSSAAGACRRPSRRRSSATTAPTPKARPPSSASPTCSPTTRRARRCRPRELLQTARAVGLGPAGAAHA